MPLPQLRSPLARALVPVGAGLVVLGVIALATWGSAVYVANHEDPPETFVPGEIELGGVKNLADLVEDDGPILLPGLDTTSGRHSLVVDHQASSDADGWRVYMAYPADRDESCYVVQVRQSAMFTDCKGRTLDVTQLADPPRGVFPFLENNRTRLSIDLGGFSSTPETTTSTTTAT